MILTYKDPKKKKLQMFEIIAMILLLPPGLYYGYGAYANWKAFSKAEAICQEASKFLHSGMYAEGVSKLEEAIAVCPDYYGAWESLGTTYHMMGNHELEVATYERAIAVLPKSGNLHRELASAYHKIGQHEKELEAAQIASKLPNTDPHFTSRGLSRAQKEASGEISTDLMERPKIDRLNKLEEQHNHRHGDGNEHSHEGVEGHTH